MSLSVVDQMDLAPADVQDGGWTRYARCGQGSSQPPDPELFFPDQADSAQTYAATAYCRACPVWAWCDRDAARDRRPGVWAGIYRQDNGSVAPLCPEPGCLRWASEGGGRRCHECSRKARMERQAERRQDPAYLERERAAATARRRAKKAAETRPPVAEELLEVCAV
jgi:hypothetical protein